MNRQKKTIFDNNIFVFLGGILKSHIYICIYGVFLIIYGK